MDKPIPEAVVDAVAQAIADVVGHGMAEKCEAQARAAIAALTAAQQQGQAVAWEYLGTSSLAGPWPTAEWKPCDDPDAARSAGYEVRQKPMQQGGGEVARRIATMLGAMRAFGTSPDVGDLERLLTVARAAPPSAPVGVEAEHVETLRRVMGLLRDTAALQGREHISLGIAFADAIDHFYLLAQQPTAVDEAKVSAALSRLARNEYGDPRTAAANRSRDIRAVRAALATQHQEPTT